MSNRLVCAALLAAAMAFAQSERGSITGIISDASGANIAHAPVKVINQATNTAENIFTSAAGDYNAANLAPGVYRIEVTAPGFRSFVEAGVTVTAGATVRIDARDVSVVPEAAPVAADLDEVGKASGPDFWKRVQALGKKPYYPPPKL